jgi:hypothetical protein
MLTGVPQGVEHGLTDAGSRPTTSSWAWSPSCCFGGGAPSRSADTAYHISQSGEGGTHEENWHRAEAELREGQ